MYNFIYVCIHACIYVCVHVYNYARICTGVLSKILWGIQNMGEKVEITAESIGVSQLLRAYALVSYPKSTPMCMCVCLYV